MNLLNCFFGKSNKNLIDQDRDVLFYANKRGDLKNYFSKNLRVIANLKKGERLELDQFGYLRPQAKSWSFFSSKDQTIESIQKIVDFWSDYCAAVPLKKEDADNAEELAVKASWAIKRNITQKKSSVDEVIEKLTNSTLTIRDNHEAKYDKDGSISPIYRQNSWDNLKNLSEEVQQAALNASFLGENFADYAKGSKEDSSVGYFNDVKDLFEVFGLEERIPQLAIDFQYMKNIPDFEAKCAELIDDLGKVDGFLLDKEEQQSVFKKLQDSHLFPHFSETLRKEKLNEAQRKKEEEKRYLQQMQFVKNLGISLGGAAILAGATGVAGPLGAVVAYYAQNAALGGMHNAFQDALANEPKEVKLALIRDYEAMLYLIENDPQTIFKDTCDQAVKIKRLGDQAALTMKNILSAVYASNS